MIKTLLTEIAATYSLTDGRFFVPSFPCVDTPGSGDREDSYIRFIHSQARTLIAAGQLMTTGRRAVDY
jgi:hypothetical protein